MAEEPEALVGRVASREPDREHVRVKRAGGGFDPGARLMLGEPVDPAALLDERHQLRALLAPRAPQLGVGHRVERLPGRDVAGVAPPGLTDVVLEQTADRSPDPARQVHAVGDMRDRHPFHRPLWPQPPPHLTGDATVAAADAVRRAAHPQAELRHPERLPRILGVIATQPQKRLGIDTQLGDQIADRAGHLLAGIGLVTGRNRRVRGEHRPLPGGRQRRLDRRSARRLSTRQLQHRERRMPLVQMHQYRVDPQRRQRAHPTSAEQRVLRQARDRICDIQLRGDPPRSSPSQPWDSAAGRRPDRPPPPRDPRSSPARAAEPGRVSRRL